MIMFFLCDATVCICILYFFLFEFFALLSIDCVYLHFVVQYLPQLSFEKRIHLMNPMGQ